MGRWRNYEWRNLYVIRKNRQIMNNKRFIFAAAAVVLAACSQEVIEPAVEQVPVKLAYTTVDAVESKAAQNLNEGTFASGENVTVRVSNTGENTWTDYTFTTGDAGAMTAPNPGPYYPAGSQNIDIVAYYPATAGTSFTVAADQTDDADYKASDLMFASVSNQAKQVAPVNLAFTHKMAKLNVNITAGQGVSRITSLSVLNVKPTVLFDQTTGAVGEASGTATSIALSNNGAVIIPAQTINGGLLSIVTDQGTATYSVASKEFAAGQLYTINITVNLRAVGTTTAITGWTSEGTVTVNPVTNQKTPAGLVAVDMGNGLKWANMNVGAESVTDYGDYFAWGATKPFYVGRDAYGNAFTGHWIDGKTGYDWANYPFMQSGQSDRYHITKYTFADGQTSGIWYDGGTFKGDNGDGVEHKDFASYDYADDAARANWGGNWRTPTDAEWTWLRENCTWTWQTDYNSTGIKGMLVRSKIDGYTDNTIFLPAAGYRIYVGLDAGSDGYYWSSALSEFFSDYARCVYFNSSVVDRSGGYREHGYSVRPVTE
jgi:hypothetical protein